MGTVDKTVFIVNPYARKGSTEFCWPTIQERARDRLGPFEAYITAGPGDARRFANHAIANEVELLVCVGGDGTFNEVINGCMDNDASARSGLTLGFIPTRKYQKNKYTIILWDFFPVLHRLPATKSTEK